MIIKESSSVKFNFTTDDPLFLKNKSYLKVNILQKTDLLI